MYDIIIRGGAIVDGSGKPSRIGDIALKDGKIAEIGASISGQARETIDAAGALVTPGFIDVHSHYDGQLMWDDKLDSSFSNGVTTVIAGNCGVGFAPLRHEYREKLVEMMEGVEDIPGIVLDEGLDWQWDSFPSYMDRIAARKYTMDVAVQITHAPLRVYVMGERALNHETATPEDIARMAALTREAIDAGAVGFSAARILEHKSSKGDSVPGTFSDVDELGAIAAVLGEKNKGVFQIVPLGTAGNMLGTGASDEERVAEHERMVQLVKAANGRTLTYLIMEADDNPEEWLRMFQASEKAISEGIDLRPQTSARGTGFSLTLDGYHPFQCCPSYMEIAHLPLAERIEAMSDPARKAAILSEEPVSEDKAPNSRIWGLNQRFLRTIELFFIMDLPLDYEPGPERRVDAIAKRTGRSPKEVHYDHLISGDGHNFMMQYLHNYAKGDLSEVHNMLINRHSVTGGADGGAHLQLTCDGSIGTFHLTFWGRDRTRGPKIPVERLVQKMTADNADLYSMTDRGRLDVGMRADINVIDHENLSLELLEMKSDLPLGGKRLVQKSKGYVATIVNGVVTRRNDEDTGARPGRLYRG